MTSVPSTSQRSFLDILCSQESRNKAIPSSSRSDEENIDPQPSSSSINANQLSKIEKARELLQLLNKNPTKYPEDNKDDKKFIKICSKRKTENDFLQKNLKKIDYLLKERFERDWTLVDFTQEFTKEFIIISNDEINDLIKRSLTKNNFINKDNIFVIIQEKFAKKILLNDMVNFIEKFNEDFFHSNTNIFIEKFKKKFLNQDSTVTDLTGKPEEFSEIVKKATEARCFLPYFNNNMKDEFNDHIITWVNLKGKTLPIELSFLSNQQ